MLLTSDYASNLLLIYTSVNTLVINTQPLVNKNRLFSGAKTLIFFLSAKEVSTEVRKGKNEKAEKQQRF